MCGKCPLIRISKRAAGQSCGQFILVQILAYNVINQHFNIILHLCISHTDFPITISYRHIHSHSYFYFDWFNPLTPNDQYWGRTAPLTSKVAFYIFIQQI